MHHELDEEMRGHALLFDGPLELVEHARKANDGRPDSFIRRINIQWPGRRGTTWKDIDTFVRSPWPEAVRMIKTAITEVMKGELPQPLDARRKPRWSEVEGDVEIDRAMHGDPDYLRLVKRQRVRGPMNVCIVSNMDTSTRATTNSSGLFFRSAGTIALADILNDLGYTVEIWCWTRGAKVYPEPYPNQFVACRPLKAGDPVDFDALADTMSHWFTQYAVFGAFAAGPVRPLSPGIELTVDEYAEDVTKVETCGIGGWIKYLDIGPDVFAVSFPMVYGWYSESGSGWVQSVSRAAAQVLQAVVDRQNGG